MVRTFLVRGMLVGIVAGLLSFGFLKIYGEPQVDRAIAFEERMDEEKAEFAKRHNMPVAEEQPELVSRPVQAGLGLFVAVMVYSAAFGGLFGLVFAFAQGRMPGELSPRALAALLALIGFIGIYLVPNLKYPANPPSVGNPDTIGARTALYFGMIGISLIAMIGAVNFRRMLATRYGGWNATLVVVAYYLVVMVAAALLLPTVNEVPDEFPAVVLWKFRVASLAAQLIMWTTLGLLFGGLTQRAMALRTS
jgi:predicted cobalt transporter CbtA